MKKTTLLIILFSLPRLALAFTTTGFANPFGVAIDPASGYIYVSNVNGSLDAKLDNGYISRLKADGSVEQMRFINGADQGVELNAPKGMAIIGEQLYVADIDVLRVFHLGTGRVLTPVKFDSKELKHLYDVFVGPDKQLYVTDAPANTVYRIDSQMEIQRFIKDDALGQPRAIAWDPVRQYFLIAGWSSGRMTAYDRAGKQQQLPSMFLRTLEGVAISSLGEIFVSSSSLRTIYRIDNNFALYDFKLEQDTPAGMVYQAKTNSLIVTHFSNNKVVSYPLENHR